MSTRIKYLRDPANDERVLTLVTKRIDENTVQFGWAVNRPTEWVNLSDAPNYAAWDRRKGDSFTRVLGRTIAQGRLDNSPEQVVCDANTPPLRAVLDHLVHHSPHQVVRRIAAEHRHVMDVIHIQKQLQKAITPEVAAMLDHA